MRTALILLFSSLLGFAQLHGQDFNHEWHKLDSLQNIKRLVLNSCIDPHWYNNEIFYYETRDNQDKKFIKANITDCTKIEIPADSVKRRDKKENGNDKEKTEFASPNGKKTAYLRDFNVWVRDSSDKKGKPISFDGCKDNFYCEVQWSPNSKRIAAIKKRDVKERQIPIIESAPKDQLQPKLTMLDYCKPGDEIPIYLPALFDVENFAQIAINTQPFENQYYLNFARWKDDSSVFTFEFNQRGHQVYQVVNVDANTGSCKVVVNETEPTFIYYYRLYLKFLKKQDNLLWISERDGWRHLYLINATTGEVNKQLTSGEWVVRDVYEVNEDENHIIFSANGRNKGEDPYNLHYYKMGIDGSNLTDLTPENGNHEVIFAEDMKHFIDTYSRPNVEPTTVVRTVNDGSVAMDLGKANIDKLLKTGWKRPEVFVAKARDGQTDIYGNIYFPSNYNPKKKYPVVEYIYAGPHDAFVLKDFYPYLRFSKLQELGFIVVTIDGMGTANRSKEFHDVCWRNLKDSGFPDRKLWIKAAAQKFKAMDISNGVGIYGYSAGGQSTLAALLFQGDFYKVGVSLCGCHDNRMDKIWWNEQWMGYPIGPWYSKNSNVDNAHLLNGKLLIINGEIDNNVDPASTLQVVRALIDANKDFEQLYLPGYSHNLGDQFVTRRVFKFFYENMK